MKVYRPTVDVNHYQYFLPESEDDWDRFEMDCVPKKETWSPPPVYVYRPKHIPGDFYSFGFAFLVTSPRATEELRTFLEMAGELLPLPYRGEVFTVLNVTECINCLDHEKTVWTKDSNTGENVTIKEYVFHPKRFSESRIFKIPETSRAEILVVEWDEDSEDEFRYAVNKAGLKGLTFELLWQG